MGSRMTLVVLLVVSSLVQVVAREGIRGTFLWFPDTFLPPSVFFCRLFVPSSLVLMGK